MRRLLAWLTPMRPFRLREAIVRYGPLRSGEVLVFDHIRCEVRVEREPVTRAEFVERLRASGASFRFPPT